MSKMQYLCMYIHIDIDPDRPKWEKNEHIDILCHSHYTYNHYIYTWSGDEFLPRPRLDIGTTAGTEVGSFHSTLRMQFSGKILVEGETQSKGSAISMFASKCDMKSSSCHHCNDRLTLVGKCEERWVCCDRCQHSSPDDAIGSWIKSEVFQDVLTPWVDKHVIVFKHR